MKPPIIRVCSHRSSERRRERGVTMILVAVAMIAIIAMAALSIDVVTLYLAKEEAQRAADAAALAAARVISLSGIMGDPRNTSGLWADICGPGGSATQAAQAVAKQGTVGSIAGTITVSYSAGGSAPALDCSPLPAAGPFGVNPLVTVKVTRSNMPSFFSRIWGNTGNSVTGTATAEAFNPSNSATVGNVVTGTLTPVQPRCVKPWIVPNRDPLSPASCTNGCNHFVDQSDGRVLNAGVSTNGDNSSGVIGERFWLEPDCRHTGSICRLRTDPPEANYFDASVRAFLQPPPSLEYLPGDAPSVAPVAIASACTSGRPYEEAIAGCDQATKYQCGVQSSASGSPNQVNLSENPSSGSNDTMNGVKCLIHQADENDPSPTGQDTINLTSYPFKILSGSSNPLGGGVSGSPLTTSNSIVSLPIYDDAGSVINSTGTSQVTIVGFLQVFINRVDQYGNVQVVVLNVAGCSNGAGPDPVSTSPITGSSPVPVRLITPP